MEDWLRALDLRRRAFEVTHRREVLRLTYRWVDQQKHSWARHHIGRTTNAGVAKAGG
jgi:hypothetical protein